MKLLVDLSEESKFLTKLVYHAKDSKCACLPCRELRGFLMRTLYREVEEWKEKASKQDTSSDVQNK